MFNIASIARRKTKTLGACSSLKPLVTRLSRAQKQHVSNVARLSSWDLEEFRKKCFTPVAPGVLPQLPHGTIPACTKWFEPNEDNALNATVLVPKSFELNPTFWRSYSQIKVPLEITWSSTNTSSVSFERVDAPLELLLSYLSPELKEKRASYSVYLAQHDLRDLPEALQIDLPRPSLVDEAGKGDLYSSSLWLGRPPTYTPLHRDPNPNLFVQLAGTKIVRLFRPEIGDAIFEHAKHQLSHSSSTRNAQKTMETDSAALRGEEMMQGSERTVLHDLVWSGSPETNLNNAILQYAQDATLGQGEALFIPKGWWHSVKGLGDGVTASANWWFR